VSALKADDTASAFGQPINQFAFAFVAPLGAYDNYVSTNFIHCTHSIFT
jgi:hypothetical protein